jgi:hypothetical protein
VGMEGVKSNGLGIIILCLTPAQHGAGSIAVFGGPGWWDGEFGQELGQGLHCVLRGQVSRRDGRDAVGESQETYV